MSSRKIKSVSWLRVGVTVPPRTNSRKRNCWTLPPEHVTPVHVPEQGSVPVHDASTVAPFAVPFKKACNTAPSLGAAVTAAAVKKRATIAMRRPQLRPFVVFIAHTLVTIAPSQSSPVTTRGTPTTRIQQLSLQSSKLRTPRRVLHRKRGSVTHTSSPAVNASATAFHNSQRRHQPSVLLRLYNIATGHILDHMLLTHCHPKYTRKRRCLCTHIR